jgi:cell filamentation protein
MSVPDRYAAEDEAQPGSRGLVLKNLLGITDVREMEQAETTAQLIALDKLADSIRADQRFVAADLLGMHQLWLGGIYPWAGTYRTVDISKDGHPFCHWRHIEQSMRSFEADELQRFTPCLFDAEEDVAHALAAVHAELNPIHPFREGNGRVSRMLALAMSWQAGLPGLDFGGMRAAPGSPCVRALQRSGTGAVDGELVELFRVAIQEGRRIE